VTRVRALLLGLGLAGACGGPATDYAGTWTRSGDTPGVGARELGIDAFGKMSLTVPQGDSAITMSGRGTFLADTLVFPADTTGAECQRTEARYLLARDTAAAALVITVHGEDRCPGRAGALPGRWTRLVR
jgi:hypothetical protein